MGSTIMMYVLPMLLGQTYHLGKEQPGIPIYPTSIMNETVKIQRYFTDSQYRMVENAAQMRDFLDVSGKLSLKIKAGLLDVSGEGKYLKDSSSKKNGLEILVKVHFETITVTIPSSVRPIPGFLSFPRSQLGTHFCRSITYGGDLLASIRISGSGESDLEHIKGAINTGLKTKGGSFEGDIKGKLEKLKKSALESASMEINYYASVPVHGVSYTIDGLLKLVEDFPDHVKRVNRGLGNPLRMELYPLSSLEENFSVYAENRALTDELEDLDSCFDDLRTTRRELAEWISQLPPTLPESAQKTISSFSNRLSDVYSVFLSTISELDTSQGTSTDLLKKALKAYRGGDYMLPKKYARRLRQLRKKILEENPDLKPKHGGAQYFRWGRAKCDSTDTETTLSGVAVTSGQVFTDSKENLHGRSSDYICLPLNPDGLDATKVFVNYEYDSEDSKTVLVPLSYEGGSDRHKNMKGKIIACSHCRVNSRKVVMTKMASNDCPESWTKEYNGYVLGPLDKNGVPGQFVCVDSAMTEPSGKVQLNYTEGTHGLTEITVQCGSLPCKPYKASATIPCVVCSI